MLETKKKNAPPPFPIYFENKGWGLGCFVLARYFKRKHRDLKKTNY